MWYPYVIQYNIITVQIVKYLYVYAYAKTICVDTPGFYCVSLNYKSVQLMDTVSAFVMILCLVVSIHIVIQCTMYCGLTY